ncbi:MAG: hypothetical protein WC836_04045 [Desulfobacula sp.]|jgi:hypothetical protein
MSMESWISCEIGLAAMVISLLLAVLVRNVSQSGAWDGDPPAHRNRLVMETVNVFVAEQQIDGHPVKAFMQSFHRFPTMLHEAILAGFILLINGINPVNFDTETHLAAWFATFWTIAGVWVLYFTMRKFAARQWVLLVLPICVITGYILLYANFPRQNMAAHAVGWMAFYFYVIGKKSGNLSASIASSVGLLYGVAVALHFKGLL